jgi:hypothetical protein
MADAGLFVGWGEPVRGREGPGLQVFTEALEYDARLQQEGRIESFEVFLLEPHGGDLSGFVVLRGTPEQIDAVQRDPDFERQIARAGMIVQSLGVVRAYLGDSLGRQIALYEEAVGELG